MPPKGQGNQRLSKPLSADHEFKIYPNPSEGVIRLDYVVDQTQSANLRIFDVKGRLLAIKSLTEGATHQFNLSELESGLYIYSISIDHKEQERGKLIIQ